ncbi:hypothetical protein [Streptomyces rochei]|uniref:hypothetical protein n=1 Tax=Streptomyces rochei TaxID=1928 RepID=UPI0036FE5B79
MTDQTTPLRDRIAAALYEHSHPGWAISFPDLDQDQRDTYLARADAVLAVLPAPADRAAVLRDAANALAVLGPVDSLVSGPKAWAEAVETLRRMADETATTETQAGAPGRGQTVEYFVQSQQPDGTWESASSFSTDLDFAAARLAARREKMPDLTLRLAERTTTVAVRALPDCLSCRHWSCDGTGECGALLDAWQRCDCTGPAAGARQDGAQ